MGDISKNFSFSEFMCKCENCNGWGDASSHAAVRQNIINLVNTILQPLRDKLDEAIFISSGVRCSAHNRAVGGVPDSRHLVGQAADIVTKTLTPGALAKIVETLPVGGIGIYSSFVHVDTGMKGRRW